MSHDGGRGWCVGTKRGGGGVTGVGVNWWGIVVGDCVVHPVVLPNPSTIVLDSVFTTLICKLVCFCGYLNTGTDSYT